MPTNAFRPAPDIAIGTLVRTRVALHGLAECVLAADLYRHIGKIGLRPTPGGFGTPTFMVDGVTRQSRIDGVQLVTRRDDDEYRADVTSLAAAGAFLGVDPTPPEIYRSEMAYAVEEPLELDPVAVAAFADWFELGSAALARFAAGLASGVASAAQLWPEHFDLAITAEDVNYGVSPGDDGHDLPYAYVGPFERPVRWQRPRPRCRRGRGARRVLRRGTPAPPRRSVTRRVVLAGPVRSARSSGGSPIR
jgi:hypothetical protein